MTDPLRTDHLPEAGEVPERERDARVEDLLLAGLDHYFVGQHELAISVWTRVLFLDRATRGPRPTSTARAAPSRSVSARARSSCIPARPRSIAATPARARTLLTSAVERGAHSEEALVLLERLTDSSRRESAPHARWHRRSPTRSPSRALADKSGSSRAAWIATGVLAGLATAGVVAWIALTRPDWLPFDPAAIAPRTAVAEEPLPIPSPSEAWVSRARGLYDDGRLRDALGVLDAVGESDPLQARGRRVARGHSAQAARSRARLPASARCPGRGGRAASAAAGETADRLTRA